MSAGFRDDMLGEFASEGDDRWDGEMLGIGLAVLADDVESARGIVREWGRRVDLLTRMLDEGQAFVVDLTRAALDVPNEPYTEYFDDHMDNLPDVVFLGSDRVVALYGDACGRHLDYPNVFAVEFAPDGRRARWSVETNLCEDVGCCDLGYDVGPVDP